MQHRKALLAAAALVLLMVGQSMAIERVPSKFGYLEVRSGYAMPLGTYSSLLSIPFYFDGYGYFSYDADRVFNDGYNIGLAYGQLFGPHWRTSFGFEYGRNKIKNPITQQSGIYEFQIPFTDDLTYQQYDLSLCATYSPLSLVLSPWSPYVGLGGALGIAGASAPGYNTEYEFTTSLSLEAGVDVKLWTAPDDRSFLTLSSINRWDFAATGDRIKQLQIGGGLRYFFKP